MEYQKTVTPSEAADLFGMYEEDMAGMTEYRVYETETEAHVYIGVTEEGKFWSIVGRDEIMTASLADAETWLSQNAAYL